MARARPRYTLLSSALFVPAGSSLGLLDHTQRRNIIALIVLTGASLALTNRAEERPWPA